MQAYLSLEWQPPDWLAQAAAWAGSLVVAGGAKPAFDWWQGRGKERREARKEELDAATELREEMRAELRTMRSEIKERDDRLDTLQREIYELLAKIASLTAENQIIRAHNHRLLGELAGFYAVLQMKWKLAGLPMADIPKIPDWVHESPDGPTASFREPTP